MILEIPILTARDRERLVASGLVKYPAKIPENVTAHMFRVKGQQERKRLATAAKRDQNLTP